MKRLVLILLIVALAPMCCMAAAMHIYRGNSTYTSDILFTWDGRYLYVGNSTYTSDILCTITNGHLYRGRSTYTSDILLTYTAPIPLPILLLATIYR